MTFFLFYPLFVVILFHLIINDSPMHTHTQYKYIYTYNSTLKLYVGVQKWAKVYFYVFNLRLFSIFQGLSTIAFFLLTPTAYTNWPLIDSEIKFVFSLIFFTLSISKRNFQFTWEFVCLSVCVCVYFLLIHTILLLINNMHILFASSFFVFPQNQQPTQW